jgi:hypothetical protein
MTDHNNKVYSRLQVELYNGTPEDTQMFKGLSSITTVRSFRAVIAARIGRAPKDVCIMVEGQALDDCE